jgi:hypothetical protein
MRDPAPGPAPHPQPARRRGTIASTLLALAATALSCATAAAPAVADSPPPLKASVGGTTPVSSPACSAHFDQYGTPGWWPDPNDPSPCISGWPSDEGWPTVSGAIGSIARTQTRTVASGEGTRPATFYEFEATVNQAPGSVLGHFGPECANKGTSFGFDCHLSPRDHSQWADFAAGDDRLWLAYHPSFYSLPASHPCSDLWTQIFVFDELHLYSDTPGSTGVTTLPSIVAATGAKNPQAVTGTVGVIEQPQPTTQRLCLTVTMDTTPQKLRLLGLDSGPLWILAEATYNVPASAPTVRTLIFAEITHAARARLAKLKAWRNGTGRRLKITSRTKTSANVRATWHTRGKHPKRYALTVTVRKTLKGTTARLGHTINSK